MRKTNTPLLLFIPFLILAGGSSHASTWAAFAKGKAAVVARTMDWLRDDNAVVTGHGRNRTVSAADTPNALRYTSAYASIRIHSFAGRVVEAMNDKGLQGSVLFLDGSRLPAPQTGRGDVDPNNFVAYAVSNFATVREVVDSLRGINFVPATMDLPGSDTVAMDYPPEEWPGHFAFADALGDKVVIEFIDGAVKIYHGPEHDALTNEPAYEVHLALDAIGYQATGFASTIDCRARAKNHLRYMNERGVDTPRRAVTAMRGLLASVSSGSEEPDRMENEVYATWWTALADLNAGRYYLSRLDSWCGEMYDFSMFDGEKAEVATLTAAGCPCGKIDLDEGAAPAAAVTNEILLRASASWDDTPYRSYPATRPELSLVRIVIPADTALGWHTHPMPNAAYVVKGELTVVRRDNGLTKRLAPGQALPEMMGTAHRGFSGSEPVELLVFYAGTPGMPLSEAADVE